MISYNGPLWFLTCPFVTELLFFGLAKRYYWQRWKLVISFIIAGIIGYLYSINVPFSLPWNADVALTAVVFYGVGNLFRRFLESVEKIRVEFGLPKTGSKSNNVFFVVEKFLPVFFILVSILYFAYLLQFPTDKINMSVTTYGGFLSFYFLAFSGIFTFAYIFKKIGSLEMFEYYGRNSLIVLALHFPMKDILIKLFTIFVGIELDCFCCITSTAITLTILNLLGLVPVIFLINRYIPFLAGKRRPTAGLGSPKFRFRNL